MMLIAYTHLAGVELASVYILLLMYTGVSARVKQNHLYLHALIQGPCLQATEAAPGAVPGQAAR